MNFKKTTCLSMILAVFPVFQSYATAPIERASIDTVVGVNPNPNGDSIQPAVSADGRFISFESNAGDLVAGDTNGINDIFHYDRVFKTTTRVSVSSSGTQANGLSEFSDISDNGRYIVFSSRATNLTADTYPGPVADPDNPGFTIQPKQIFLRDTSTNTTKLITTIGGTASGSAANNISTKPVISADGRYIVYESLSSNITTTDTDTISDIFRFDTVTNTTVLVSVNTNGTKGNAGSEEASVSDNGRYIAFASDASNIGGTADLITDVFYRDMNTGITQAVTSGSNAAAGFNDSQQPVISSDGKYIAFESFRVDLVSNQDTNGTQDLFLYNTSNKVFSLISRTPAGAAGDARSGHPGISSDGRYIVFESAASNLDTVSDTNNDIDIFVRDTTLNITTRISTDLTGTVGPGLSEKPRISSDGRYTVFSSKSPLVADDTQAPQLEDIYFADRAQYNDFNGNGTSDIVWRNDATGQNWMYLMNSQFKTLSAEINKVADLTWKIVGIGDFDGDTKSDILWRNAAGLNWMYLMDGNKIKTSSRVNAVIDSNWQVAGIGDLNADGKDDIIWRNVGTGLNWTYLMNGVSIASSLKIDVVINQDWFIQDVADFNADGRDDILWRNVVDGLNWMYLMNGRSIATSTRINEVTNTDWEVQGAADFNRDGMADILWRNKTTGSNWLYTMNGSTIVSSLPINSLGTSWEVAAIADFNNNKRADILWRNKVHGENWIYFMNGKNITSIKFVDKVSNLNWKIIPR